VDRRRVLLSAIGGLSGALVGAALLKRVRRTAGRPWPANFAHRGAAARAPENTLEAFRLAVEAGAGGLELDVHLTRDGEVVVIHDATVDRVTDGSGAVAGMTLEEVRRLDAGDSFSPDGGQTFP
jgi:glycerophosphoryl diester phosphodiesterase